MIIQDIKCLIMNSAFDSLLLTREMHSQLLYTTISLISDLKNYIIEWLNLQSNLILLLREKKQIFKKRKYLYKSEWAVWYAYND